MRWTSGHLPFLAVYANQLGLKVCRPGTDNGCSSVGFGMHDTIARLAAITYVCNVHASDRYATSLIPALGFSKLVWGPN